MLKRSWIHRTAVMALWTLGCARVEPARPTDGTATESTSTDGTTTESTSTASTEDGATGGRIDGCPWTLTALGTPNSSTAHVRVFFSVTDIAGEPVESLVCSDFNALENGAVLDVHESAFNIRAPSGNVRIPTVLVLDLSRSVVEAGALETVKDAARSFIDALGADQELAILTFASVVTVRSNFTTDTKALHAAIDAITKEDGVSTNLYGALVQGYGMWQDGFVEIVDGPTKPRSCVPILNCPVQGLSCQEVCQTQGTTCDEYCDDYIGGGSGGGGGGGCEGLCQQYGYASCDDYCVQEGYVDGCDEASLECILPNTEGRLTAGLLVVISDGNDTAAVSTKENVLTARGSKRTLFVAVGSEIDLVEAGEIGNAGLFDVLNFAGLSAEIGKVLARAQAFGRAIYVAEYCSPKRAGSHKFVFAPTCNLGLIDQAHCQPSTGASSCNGNDVFCGNADASICCPAALPYHCAAQGTCFATAENAALACGSDCFACGDEQEEAPDLGLSIKVDFQADSFNDAQCLALFDAATSCK